MNWQAAIGILLVPVIAIAGWYLIQTYVDREVPHESFVREGNLMKDNPGFEPHIWYLSYEEPGSPGLALPLIFDHDSRCGSEETLKVCNISFEQGERVHIEGVREGEAVRVQKLLYLREQ